MQDNLDAFRRAGNVSNTGRTSASTNALPSFGNDENQSDSYDDEELIVPTPNSQLREKHHHYRLHDIEDEFLSESIADEELSFLNQKLPSRQKNVYVNLKDYNDLLVTVRENRSNFKVFTEKFNRIDNICVTLDAEISNSQKLLESMQRRIIGLDNRLFEKVEDEQYE